ncbi:MAG TPA: DUF3300 domain-containing protein [Methylophilaceae bacterium]|jgi:hypothetical protein
METTLYSKFSNKSLAIVASIQLLLVLLFAPLAFAEDNQDTQAEPEFTQQELDQMLAPIALYPDSLLSQVLMASTYPLEVVQAARWSRAHPGLKGDDAVKAVEKNNWDPSVISLTAFPQVLQQMDEKIDWTERLGDAFLAQEPQVMDTVQDLRQKAQDAGNLQSNDQIRVEPQGQTIVIEQAAPQIIYVPYYNPAVVYGPWWWDAYPPVYWDPWPGYYQPGFRTTFYWGNGITISGGFFFSNFDWHRRHVNIVNVHNYYYNNYYSNPRHSNPYVDRDAHNRPSGNLRNSAPGNDSEHEWRHDPGHRHGVPYREPALQQQFGRTGANSGTGHDAQNHDATSRGTNNQPVVRPETANRSGADATTRNRRETQGNVQTPNSNAAEHSNRTDRRDNRPDGQSRSTNGTRDTVPVSPPKTNTNSTPDAATPTPAAPGRSDRYNRANRPDNSRTETRSSAPAALPDRVAPVTHPSVNTAPPSKNNEQPHAQENEHNRVNHGNQNNRDNHGGQDNGGDKH